MRRKFLLAAMLFSLFAPVFTPNVYAQNVYNTEEISEEDTGRGLRGSASTGTYSALSSSGVETHTQEEIISYIKASGAKLTDTTEYATDYTAAYPYQAGELTQSTQESALALLNNIRYIAGISHDITLNSALSEKCAAGALVNAVNDELSHYPAQPSDMEEELYSLGYSGTSNSNIACGFSTMNECLIKGWMADDDADNIGEVGHRAWCLNPNMGKTGFGAAGTYMAMYSTDQSSSHSVKNVVWPAAQMPLEYFGDSYPWSIFTGTSEDADEVEITLTRTNTDETWEFSSESADGDFYVTDYSYPGTVIFRPENITYSAGDVFEVNVSGITTPVSYTVEFFSLGDEYGHAHEYKAKSVSVDFSNMTCKVTTMCTGCDLTWTTSEDLEYVTEGVTCETEGAVKVKFTTTFNNKTWGCTINKTADEHTYGSPEFIWDGTDKCTAEYTCTVCGAEKEEECVITENTTATCTEDGIHSYTAASGEYSDVKEEPAYATGHSFTKYITDNNATCTENGTKTAVCDNGCGETDTVTDEDAPALGHSFTAYKYNGDATCIKDGTKTAECDNGCGLTDTLPDEYHAAAGHIYRDYISDGNATCEEDGTKTATCIYGCGSTDTVADEGSAAGHSFTKYVSDGNADCTNNGTKTAECDNGCGATDTVIDTKSMTGHSFTKYVVSKAATCEENGVETAVCDNGCGQTNTRAISKTGHKQGKLNRVKTATTTADGLYQAKCGVCGKVTSSRIIPKISKVTLSYTSCIYDGKKKTPAVTVLDKNGEKIESYKVSYSSNTASGTATVVIALSGDYSGTVTRTFSIIPKAVSVKKLTNVKNGVKITWNKAVSGTGYVIYRKAGNGAYKKIKTLGELTTVSYTDKTSNGVKYTYKVLVYKKIGNTTLLSSAGGQKSIYYVKPAAVKKLSASSGKLAVKLAKTGKISGYQIQYSKKKSFSGAKTVKNTKNTAVIKKMKKGTYYVRVRCYKKVSGKTYYSAWSKAKTVRVR